MTIQEIIAKYKITITSESAPLRKDDAKNSFRYVVKIHCAGKALTVNYFCGSAYVGTPIKIHLYNADRNEDYFKLEWKMLSSKECEQWRAGHRYGKLATAKPIPPQIESVLECVASDLRGLACSPLWSDYAENYGMNVDSIKEKALFEEVEKQYLEFRKTFGYAMLNELVEFEE